MKLKALIAIGHRLGATPRGGEFEAEAARARVLLEKGFAEPADDESRAAAAEIAGKADP